MPPTRDPPAKGVRISIYLSAELAKAVDDAAYASRKTRSKYLADVIAKVTKPRVPGVPANKAVSGL